MYSGSINGVSISNISSADPFGVTLSSFVADGTITSFTLNVLPT